MTSLLDAGTLSDVRSVARARAEEDFEFFANSVLGYSLSEDVCDYVALCAKHGVSPEDLSISAQRAYDAWCLVLKSEGFVGKAPTETFAWLFAERVAA